MEIDTLLEHVIHNLKKNGFPDRKVSFPRDALRRYAEKHDYELEDLLGELEQKEVYSRANGERLVFSAEDPVRMPGPEDLDTAALMKQARELWERIPPSKREELRSKMENLSSSEKNEILEWARKMGLS
jgi:hypothetical protein